MQCLRIVDIEESEGKKKQSSYDTFETQVACRSTNAASTAEVL
jgi:hypothetical protein